MSKNACDCHVHVFGPYDHFPLSASRPYTPPPAPLGQLRRHLHDLSLDRVVIVQPSVYGTDNSCLTSTLSELGGAARGVAVIDFHNQPDLKRLHEAGVRGLRVNLVSTTGVNVADAIGKATQVAKAMSWHLQLFVNGSELPVLVPLIKSLPVPVVLDHFGMVAPGQHDAARSLVDLTASGIYVKLSAPYLLCDSSNWTDMEELALALVTAAPDRLLWASNWPHPGGGVGQSEPATIIPARDIDERALLAALDSWLPDTALRHRVLVENPARLYEFG